MSRAPFDTSAITLRPRLDEQASPRKKILSPPRLHSNRISVHQYLVREGDLYTLLAYDKDHDRAPYIQRWTVNIPGRELKKGSDIFKLEKVARDSKHRYNVDIYRQKTRINPDLTYPDEKRRGFPVVEFMKKLGNVLVSRQEIDGEGVEGSIGDGQTLQVFLN